MPRPTMDVDGQEYQAILRGREMHRRHGADYKDMMWAEDALDRLEKKLLHGDYTDKDYADFLKVRDIHARVFGIKHDQSQHTKETADNHTTTHYIWRTQGDGKVRANHAANNGKVFAWNEPPPTQHPGEDFGCRCWAEPYREGTLQEHSSQVVTTYTSVGIHAWNDDDLRYHYFNGNGRGLLLGHIGLLQGVMDYARIHPQKSGGSVFDRVARKIFVKARQNGSGSFRVDFGTSYNFQDFLFSLGDSTVEGQAEVRVREEEEFLSISASIYYTFWDRYKDPLDIYDVIPVDVEIPGGVPYNITDAWTVRLNAVIRKDSKESIYPDDEFGQL